MQKNNFPVILTLFGVTGDLSRKKLLPALWHLFEQNKFPHGFALVGFGRRPWSQDEFKSFMSDALTEHDLQNPTQYTAFLAQSYYVEGTFDMPSSFETLRDCLAGVSQRFPTL